MKFTLRNKRDVVGQHIDVTVVAEGAQRISWVETKLDGSALETDTVTPPVRHYERSFRQAGNASPGREHTLQVSARDTGGGVENAQRSWQDES